MSRSLISRRFALSTVGTTMVLLALCTQAGAQEFKLGEDPVSAVMKWRPTTADPEVKDFVRASRPNEGSLDYKPLRGPRAERPKLKDKDGLKGLVSDMDAKAAAVRARAGVTAAATPTRKPARTVP